jgi:hypothetical protein
LADDATTGTSPRIFINYRREQDPGNAGRLYDFLSFRFGADNVFIDVDNIEPGQDFVGVLNDAVGQCDALVAVIGPDWIDASHADGSRRLADPNDFVRLEIEAALARGVRVVPVLVDGARMPSADRLPESLAPFSRHQALELTHQRWRFDVGRLADSLERLRPLAPPPPPTAPAERRPRRKLAAIIAGGVVVAAAVVIAVLTRGDDGGGNGGSNPPSTTSSSTATTEPQRDAAALAEIRERFTVARSEQCEERPAEANKTEIVCPTGDFLVSLAKWKTATAMRAWTDYQERTYNTSGLSWNSTTAQNVGVLMEYTDPNEEGTPAYIYWTYDAELLSVRATHNANDANALHLLWEQDQVGYVE